VLSNKLPGKRATLEVKKVTLEVLATVDQAAGRGVAISAVPARLIVAGSAVVIASATAVWAAVLRWVTAAASEVAREVSTAVRPARAAAVAPPACVAEEVVEEVVVSVVVAAGRVEGAGGNCESRSKYEIVALQLFDLKAQVRSCG